MANELYYLAISFSVVTDLADTMESLQTIAEQCLPDTWEVESQLQNNSSQQNCDIVDSSVLFKCQFCEEIFKGMLHCLC